MRRLRRRSIAPRSARARARSNLGVAALERVDRLAEQKLTAVAAGHDAGGAQRHAERARGAECPGELELLLGEAFGRLAVAERELSERGFRPPREVARAGDQRARQERADGQEVVEPVCEPSLLDAQPAAGETQDRCGISDPISASASSGASA